MLRSGSSFALATSAVAVLTFAVEAWADEYLCRFGDMIRRIEVRVADPQERLPCEVVYWKDTEEPGRPQVLWTARTDAGFCDRNAEGLVGRLESAGWSCRVPAGAPSAEAAAEAPSSPALREEPAPDRPEPAVGGPSAETAAEAPSSPAVREELAPDRTEPSLEAAEREPGLVDAIERDLARLNELAERGAFDATIVAMGDLDGNGSQDAAVVMTYADGPRRMQYLVAYLSRGGSWLPVAWVGIGAPEEDTRTADALAIEDGVIRLELQPAAPDNGEADNNQVTFVVEDGRLVDLLNAPRYGSARSSRNLRNRRRNISSERSYRWKPAARIFSVSLITSHSQPNT